MLLSTMEEPVKKFNANFQPLKTISHNPDRANLLDTTSIPPPMLNESLDSARSNSNGNLEHFPLDLARDGNVNHAERGMNVQHGNNYEQYEIKGPEGQVCESKSVLDSILTKYTHISSNTFKGGATGKIKAEYMICDCKYDHLTDDPNMACGLDSGCINRELSIECPEDGCPCGPFCQNRKFSLRHYAPIQVFDTHLKGFGLRTKMALPRGSFVIEYCGEIIPTTIFKKRIIEYAKAGAQHFYFMSLKANEYIDASKKGNISRFMNHSCNPNCQLQKWVVGSQMRIGIFTLKDVPEGAELTFDYKFERYGNEAQPCYCGEPICSGFIGKEQTENSSMAIESDEELSEEEQDEEESPEHLRSQNSQAKALQSLDQVKGIVKYLMMYSGNPTKVLRAINKLLKTETVSLQRKFIHFRGLYLLERCLSEHMNTKSIVKHNILLALQMLPISTKNAIVKLESMVQQMTSAETFGFATAELAKKILESWAGLELVYKIPKRVKGDGSELELSNSVSLSSNSGSDLKRIRTSDDESERAPKLQRSASRTPPDSNYVFSSNIKLPEVNSGVVFKEIEEARLDVSWNQIISSSEDSVRTTVTETSTISVSTPNTVEKLSESSIEKMVEAAQQASRLRQEALKKKQLEELEEQKRLSLQKKKLMKERKEKQRELSQALGKRLVEKAMAESGASKEKKGSHSSLKEKRHSHHSSKEKKNSHSSSKEMKVESTSAGSKEFSISESDKITIKKLLSNAIIKVMSRYKDQMDGDLFKERAKVITKGLLEKELRKYQEEKKPVPSELSDLSMKAVKKYVKEYLSRHDINVE